MSPLILDNVLPQFLSPQGEKPCLLLVAKQIAKLDSAVADLEVAYDWPQLAIGRELSAALLQTPLNTRGRVATRWVQDQTRSYAPGPVLCTEIDLLFAPALHLDPFALFHRVGRVTRLVVAWPGNYHNNVLAYAVPEHEHYRTWKAPAAVVIDIENGR